LKLKYALFCVFRENDKTDLRQIFSGFTRKHLFITTCIEKHCTQPLMHSNHHSQYLDYQIRALLLKTSKSKIIKKVASQIKSSIKTAQ